MARLMKALSAAGLGILLFMQPIRVAAGAPQEQLRQSVDKLISILNDPQLKGEQKRNERRQKLKEVLYQRFDFTEMARRSLGSEWRRRTPEEQKEFVRLLPISSSALTWTRSNPTAGRKSSISRIERTVTTQRWRQKSSTRPGRNIPSTTGSTR